MHSGPSSGLDNIDRVQWCRNVIGIYLLVVTLQLCIVYWDASLVHYIVVMGSPQGIL